jgi:hypothetical protein
VYFRARLTTATVMSLLGISLIVMGAGLVFGGIISWRRAQADPPGSDDDAGELRTFVDSLRRTDEATEEYARSRIDRFRIEESLK